MLNRLREEMIHFETIQCYRVTCAACQARVEKAVSKVPGVTSCSVSLLTNSMGVEGAAADEQIIKAVTDAGYGASIRGSESSGSKSEGNQTIADLRNRLKIQQHLSLPKDLWHRLYFCLYLCISVWDI